MKHLGREHLGYSSALGWPKITTRTPFPCWKPVGRISPPRPTKSRFLQCDSGLIFWSGWTESNRRYLFGREEFYH